MLRCVLVNAPFGGIAVHFRLIERRFSGSERVERVDMVDLKHRPDGLVGRLPLIGSNWYLAAAWSTRRQLAALSSPPDVAMFNQVNPALFLDPTARLPPMALHLDTTPSITSSMWQYYVGHPPRRPEIERAKRRLYSRAFRAPDHVIAVSKLVKSSLVDDYGVPEASVSVIPFPVDTDFWQRRPESTSREDALRIAFVGGEFERKGGALLLAAARRPEFSDCEFHIVTQTEVVDPPPNCFIHRNVGPNSDELRELLASASIFALPTLADVSSIASLEAMAMELPVISTDVGGVPEVVVDGETGYVITPGDAEAFVDRLLALVESSELRRRMGRAGLAKVHAGHRLDRSVERYLDILESCRASDAGESW